MDNVIYILLKITMLISYKKSSKHVLHVLANKKKLIKVKKGVRYL